jgi:AraC family transcriptional regulator
MTKAYGRRLGEAVRVENAPAIVTRALRTADIAVTEIRCDNPLPQMSDPIQQEDAFLVGLHLRDRPKWEYWEDGRRASVCDLRAGENCLHDLKREPRVLIDKPYHALAFYLPRAALDAIADDANAPPIRDLSYEPGAGVNDVTIFRLGSLLLPALTHPNQANALLVDHVLLALGVHVAQTYGGMRPMSRSAGGAMAGATREGISSRQPQGRCGTQGGGARVQPVSGLFLACLPSHDGCGAAPVAN